MSNSQRVPVFDLHIRPMFRLIDVDHMTRNPERRLDLWDLKTVWRARTNILNLLGSDPPMPPATHGGPWPREWIAIFERWIATGTEDRPGHHLVKGPAPPDGYLIERIFGGEARITATVPVPSEEDRVWLELDSVRETERDYTLVREPAYPPRPPAEAEAVLSERFVLGTVTRVFITDETGRNEVPVP